VIWSTVPEDGKGHYLAVFNRTDAAQKFALQWNEVGLVSRKAYRLRDLWEHKELEVATSLEVTLQPHACALYRATE
jgi:alpha-galactosidase